MQKTRILFTGDSSLSSTGFGLYKRTLMETFNKREGIEVAEYSHSGTRNQNERTSWRHYPGSAIPGDPDYDLVNGEHRKGQYRWERVLLDFKPNLVITAQDPWQVNYQAISSLRRFYSFLTAAPIDSDPQKPEYLSTYKYSDWVVPYTKYAEDYLTKTGIRCEPHIPMGFDGKVFRQMQKRSKIKESLGLPRDSIVFGMVARNQPRKRLPELIRAFSKYLTKMSKVDKEKADKSYLLLHTSWYDQMAWDLEREILSSGVQTKIYFSYVDVGNKEVFCSLYKGQLTHSPNSGNFNGRIFHNAYAPPIEELAKVYNCIDMYIQFANAEGFGIPTIEAAACGCLPVGVDIAAQTELNQKLGGILLDPLTLQVDRSTSTNRAVMDIDGLVELMMNYSLGKIDHVRSEFSKKATELYSWGQSVQRWENLIDRILPVIKDRWNEPYTEYSWDSEQKCKPEELIAKLCSKIPITPFEMLSWYKRLFNQTSNLERIAKEITMRKDVIVHNEKIRAGETEPDVPIWISEGNTRG